MSDIAINPQPWSALVVDDDPGIRQSLRLCLEAAGGRVLGVGTAIAALDALDRSAYDVLLLDLWLDIPETGLSLVPKILARQPGIGIIVITAFATFESAVEAMKRGAADYLPKTVHAGSGAPGGATRSRSQAPRASRRGAGTAARWG